MKKVPPGQRVTRKFPVLHVGTIPEFDPATWDLQVDGAVRKKLRFSWDEFRLLPSVAITSDFHCVTGWSKLDNKWEGVRFSTIAKLSEPEPEVTSVLVTAEGGYTTSLPLGDLMSDDVLLAYKLNDQPLAPEHGSPLRLIVPRKYAYKSAKWVRKLIFQWRHELGFWEERGYSDSADPWKEERYSMAMRKDYE